MLDKLFTERTLTFVSIIAVVVLAVLLVVYSIDALILLFAGVLLAIFFRGLADWLSKHTGLGSGLSFGIVVLTVLGALAASIFFLGQNIADQLVELGPQLLNSVNNARGRLEQYGWARALLAQIPPTNEMFNMVRSSGVLSRAGGIFSGTVSVFLNFFIFLVLGIFLALEPQTYVRGALLLVPPSRRERARQVFDAVGETLRWWIVGKFGSMLAIGVLTWIGLYFLDVPLALTLAIITALFTFIPNFGPALSLIPAALLALAQDPIKAVYVVLLYVIVQVIESNLITPVIERRTVELPPALTVIMQLFLGIFVGGLGLVLAAPLTAAGLVLTQMLYVEDVLGERVSTADEKSRDEFVEKKEATEGVEKAKGNRSDVEAAR